MEEQPAGKRYDGPIEQMDANRWRVPCDPKLGMRVDGIIYSTADLLDDVLAGGGVTQVINVATLPGIVGASLAMPDIHWGYGFPIGGVAATDPDQDGVVSPGGVGYDINCGVRLMRSDLQIQDVRPRIKELVDQLFRDIPVGVGVGGPFQFAHKELRRLMIEGSRYVADLGMAEPGDLETTESAGCLADADPDAITKEAFKRGSDQCGTLGSGNHFAEVQYVDEVFDEPAAEALGLRPGGITFMIHCGSRGLGHQVCQDSLHELRSVPAKYGIHLPDRQLVCAPLDSEPGRRYLAAMRAAANFAWANRQLLLHLVRKTFARFFGSSVQDLGLRQVYDVAHNIAKMETHTVDGRPRRLCVHRKGATRAFPAGHPELPDRYRPLGQPVLIPGDMGRASYVLLGGAASMEQTFGSTCHGAGRVLSRHAAIAHARGRRIDQELAAKGIIARARGRTGLAEEQSEAYKDIDLVAQCVHSAGLSRKVARLKPIGVIKG